MINDYRAIENLLYRYAECIDDGDLDAVAQLFSNGSINAEICAKSVTVLGKLVGNIKAGEKVEVAASGSMEGDITAPRVILADGASFKGSIDMEGRGPNPSGRLMGWRSVMMPADQRLSIR